MARKANAVGTQMLQVRTTPRVRAYLDDLVRTEMFGKNPAEAAEELLRVAVRQLVQEGVWLRRDE